MNNWRELGKPFENFNEGITQTWIDNGFNCEETKKWLEIDLINYWDSYYINWLKDEKKIVINEFKELNNDQKKDLNIQFWKRSDKVFNFCDWCWKSVEKESMYLNDSEKNLDFCSQSCHQQWKDRAQKYFNDGFSKEERAGFKGLDLRLSELVGHLDLTGFVNLESLNCSWNEITSLDLSQCNNLKYLICDNNLIKEIKLAEKSPLEIINALGNDLTNLDFLESVKKESLKQLILSNNNLRIDSLLVFNQFTNLESLSIANCNKECYRKGIFKEETINRINRGCYNQINGSLNDFIPLKKIDELDLSNLNIGEGVDFLTQWNNKILIDNSLLPQSRSRLLKSWLGKREWKNLFETSEMNQFGITFGGHSDTDEVQSNNSKEEPYGQSAQSCIDYFYSSYESKLKVKELNLVDWGLTGELNLDQFPNLESLDCSFNKITKIILSSERKLKRLKFDYNQISNLGFLNKINNDELEELTLVANKLPEINLEIFSNLSNLKRLDIKKNNFFGSLAPLANLNKLNYLRINQNFQLHDNLEYLPDSLEEFDFEDNDKMIEKLLPYGFSLLELKNDYYRSIGELEKVKGVAYSNKKVEVIITEIEDEENSFDNSHLGTVDFNYKEFILRDNRPFYWQENKIKSRLPLRLLNLKTNQVENGNELSKDAQYLSLSYCWGTDWEEDSHYYGRNYSTKLTKFGRNALNKVQATWKLLKKDYNLDSDHIWIDNFCINQSDNVEKGWEVAKQKQYYSNSVATLISIEDWLGDDESKVNLAKKAITKIKKSPWFSRAWTYQEGILSKQTIFMFNDYLVDGKLLSWYQGKEGKKFSYDLIDNDSYYVTPFGCSYGIKPREMINLSLGESLRGISHRSQTLLIDKVYSILGLLPYGHLVDSKYKSNESESYNQKDLYQVLTDVTKAMVKWENNKLVIDRFGIYTFTEFPYLVPFFNQENNFDAEKWSYYLPNKIQLANQKDFLIKDNKIHLDGWKLIIKRKHEDIDSFVSIDKKFSISPERIAATREYKSWETGDIIVILSKNHCLFISSSSNDIEYSILSIFYDTTEKNPKFGDDHWLDNLQPMIIDFRGDKLKIEYCSSELEQQWKQENILFLEPEIREQQELKDSLPEWIKNNKKLNQIEKEQSLVYLEQILNGNQVINQDVVSNLLNIVNEEKFEYWFMFNSFKKNLQLPQRIRNLRIQLEELKESIFIEEITESVIVQIEELT